jgi:hypothetical protein
MYLICQYSQCWKAYNLEEVKEFLEFYLLINDLGGINYQLKVNGCWDTGNGVFVESGHLNVKLKDVEFALNVIPKEQPTHLKKKSIK